MESAGTLLDLKSEWHLWHTAITGSAVSGSDSRESVSIIKMAYGVFSMGMGGGVKIPRVKPRIDAGLLLSVRIHFHVGFGSRNMVRAQQQVQIELFQPNRTFIVDGT
jgi:hypothetical protein